MQKFLTLFFLVLSLFFILSSQVKAQAPTPVSMFPQIPGIDCGTAVSLDSAQRQCCKTPTIPSTVSWIDKLKDIPLVGSLIGDLMDPLKIIDNSVLQLSRKSSTIVCPIGYPSDLKDPNCTCLLSSQITPSPIAKLREMCADYFGGSKELGACQSCADAGGIWTSLGICMQGDLSKFIQETVFEWGIGLAGIMSLLCIIYAALQLQMSRGNPEKIKKAQELITSCITGLMLILFSVFILKVIGVDILKIPGFN